MANHNDRLTELERQLKSLWDKYDAKSAEKVEEDKAMIKWQTQIESVTDSIKKIWWALVLAFLTGIVSVIFHFLEEVGKYGN